MTSLVSGDTLPPLSSPCGRLVIIHLLEQYLSSHKPALFALWEKGGILVIEFFI